VRTRQAEDAGAGSINGIDRLIRNVQTGRPELSLSALTAVKIFVDRQGTSARAPGAGRLRPCRRSGRGSGSGPPHGSKIVLPVQVDKYGPR